MKLFLLIPSFLQSLSLCGMSKKNLKGYYFEPLANTKDNEKFNISYEGWIHLLKYNIVQHCAEMTKESL